MNDFTLGLLIASAAHTLVFLLYRMSCKHRERILGTYIEILKHENSLYCAVGRVLFKRVVDAEEARNNEGEEWKNG